MDHAPTKQLERDDDSKESHHALLGGCIRSETEKGRESRSHRHRHRRDLRRDPGSARCAGADGRRLLPRQADQARRVVEPRRGLRRRDAADRAPRREAHAGQSGLRGAEHGQRRRIASSQFSLRGRTRRRHHHRPVPEHDPARAALRQQAGGLRREKISVARLAQPGICGVCDLAYRAGRHGRGRAHPRARHRCPRQHPPHRPSMGASSRPS